MKQLRPRHPGDRRTHLQVLEADGSLRPPASKATIRQLMTHTAGLGYFFLNEGLLTYCGANSLPSP